MRKIYNLRRIAVLLIVFGLGLLVGGKFNPIIQNVYIGLFIIWTLFYDLALEDREVNKWQGKKNYSKRKNLLIYGTSNKKIKYTLRNKKIAEVLHDDKKAT